MKAVADNIFPAPPVFRTLSKMRANIRINHLLWVICALGPVLALF